MPKLVAIAGAGRSVVMNRRDLIASAVAAPPLLLTRCASRMSPATSAPPDAANAQVTVLYDAFGRDAALTKDWGYAALVELNGKRILFDTGNNPDVLAKNVAAKGVDLGHLDFVVMSHR